MKLLPFFLALLTTAGAAAQQASDYTMTVTATDGQQTVYNTAEVADVTFAPGQKAPDGPQDIRQHIPHHIVFLGHSIWRNDDYLVKYTNSGTFVTPFTGTFRGRGYQTLIQEALSFDGVSTPGPNGGYSGYSLGAQSTSDASSIAVVAGQAGNGWPSVEGAIWTIDFITNDFKRNIPIGQLSDYKQATGPTTFYGAIRQLIDKIKELSGPDAIIVFGNALPRNNSGYTSTSQNTKGHTLADYELAFLTVAALNTGWHFVDQNRLSGITDQNLPAVTADGLHLNNLGYTLAVRPWIDVLRSIK